MPLPLDLRRKHRSTYPPDGGARSCCLGEAWGRNLHGNEKTPPVNDVSKSSRQKCKQKHRHGCRNLNKRNQEWIGRQSGHEPAGSSVLHPHADIGNDGCEPEHGEGGAANGLQAELGTSAAVLPGVPVTRCCLIGCSTSRTRVERPNRCCYVRLLLRSHRLR
jgi:hypothetical protein